MHYFLTAFISFSSPETSIYFLFFFQKINITPNSEKESAMEKEKAERETTDRWRGTIEEEWVNE